MKSHASILAVLLLATAHSTSHAGQRWCGDTLYPCCPQSSMGWMLFVDENTGTPDFWWTDSVDVREIYVCVHGTQFLMVTTQKGRRHHTALVFPRPSRPMLAARLHLDPDGATLAAELAHYEERHAALRSALAEMSGGTLVEGTRLSFPGRPGDGSPVLVPGRKLELHWRGRTLKLRGYLDVYFAPTT